MGPTLFPTVFWCDRGCGSDTPSRRKAYRGCHVPRARKRAWLGSLSPCGPSPSFGVGLRLDAFFPAYPLKSGSVNLPSLSGEIPHGHGWNAPPKVRFAADSSLEGEGFEPAVPPTMSSVHSGACDATHAAIVKRGTPDRSRRRARRAICRKDEAAYHFTCVLGHTAGQTSMLN